MVSNIGLSKATELEGHEKRKFVINGKKLKHYYVGGIGAADAGSLRFKDPK